MLSLQIFESLPLLPQAMLIAIEIIQTVHKHSTMTTSHGGRGVGGISCWVLEIVQTFLARIVTVWWGIWSWMDCFEKCKSTWKVPLPIDGGGLILFETNLYTILVIRIWYTSFEGSTSSRWSGKRWRYKGSSWCNNKALWKTWYFGKQVF